MLGIFFEGNRKELEMATGDNLPVLHRVDLGIGSLRTQRDIADWAWRIAILALVILAIFSPHSKRIQAYMEPAVPIGLALVGFLGQRSISLRSKIHASEQIASDSAIELLGDAYEIVRMSITSRSRNRLDWLTAARNIRVALQLTDQIGDQASFAITREKELIYRARFRELIYGSNLSSSDGPPEAFFADSARDYIRGYFVSSGKVDPISEASLVEIYRFCQWPAGRADVLPDNQHFTETEIRHMVRFGPRGLGRLFHKVRTLEASGADMEDSPIDDSPEEFQLPPGLS